MSQLLPTSKPRPPKWRSALSLLCVLGSALLSVASSPAEPTEWAYASDFPVEVGIGFFEFSSYDALGEFPLERGFQGGQHINASLRASDLAPPGDVAVCSVFLIDPADPDAPALEENSETECQIGTPEALSIDRPLDLPGGSLVVPWLRLMVEDAEAVVGQELELRVQVETPDGEVGRAWVEAPVTWLASCEDLEEGSTAPCSDDF